MKIKNWSKTGIHGNCWQLKIGKTVPRYHKRTGLAVLRLHTRICYKLGYSGDWVLMSQWKILRRAKTKAEIYKKAIAWMRKHPNG